MVKCCKNSPVTFNITLSVAVTVEIALINTSHVMILPSSKVLNCGMVYNSVYTTESVFVEL